jgi:hypothetical protein
VKFIWVDTGVEINEGLLDGVVASCREIKRLALCYFFSIRNWSGGGPLTARFKVNRGTRDETLSITVAGPPPCMGEAARYTDRFFDYQVGMSEMLEMTNSVNEDIYKECVWTGGTFVVDGVSNFGFPSATTAPNWDCQCTNVSELDRAWGAGKIALVPVCMEELAARRLINKMAITVVDQASDGKICSVKLSVPARDFRFIRGLRHEIGDGYVIVSKS